MDRMLLSVSFSLVVVTVGVASFGQDSSKNRIANNNGAAHAEVSTNAKKNENTNQADRNIDIQRKLATFTELLVLVGFIQAVILAIAVAAIIGQTRATKNSERAWVTATPANWKPEFGVLGPQGGLIPRNVFDVAIKSVGKTPAQLLDIACHYIAIQSMEVLPNTPEYGKAATLNDMS